MSADTPLAGPWLSTEDLAKLLGINASSLRRWRTARPAQGPPFVILSERVTVYNAKDVETWLLSKRIAPGESAA